MGYDTRLVKDEVKKKAENKAKQVKPWVRNFARFGYAAKGTVYVLIGILSIMPAGGFGGRTTGSEGAFAALSSRPFGEFALWIMAFGLIGYAVWKLMETFMHIKGKEHGIKEMIKRASFLVSAVIHLGLAYKAFMIIMNAGSPGSARQTVTARLLGEVWGRWIIGIAGAIILAFAFYELYKGYKGKFGKHLKAIEMDEDERKTMRTVGKAGFIARGVVFALIGWFVIDSALEAKAENEQGMDKALSEIAQQPFGPYLLAVVAGGLLMYGIFMFFKARYRVITI
ncbi:DUF1206 domain-containing protein [Bacillus marinisedimentorum]|uniref:DUF1206 domain-containing protein n=1 Tax=Bacillus marinisedimentorum TaxID=1821260 RepID=UPI0007E0AB0B|nr:DUF1206 domain-containing protein [Bacillus marinisedimentorum]